MSGKLSKLLQSAVGSKGRWFALAAAASAILFQPEATPETPDTVPVNRSVVVNGVSVIAEGKTLPTIPEEAQEPVNKIKEGVGLVIEGVQDVIGLDTHTIILLILVGWTAAARGVDLPAKPKQEPTPPNPADETPKTI